MHWKTKLSEAFFIATFALLQWSGTKLAVSLRYACTGKLYESRASHSPRHHQELLVELLSQFHLFTTHRSLAGVGLQASIYLLRGKSSNQSGPGSALVLPRGYINLGFEDRPLHTPLLEKICPHILLPHTPSLEVEPALPSPHPTPGHRVHAKSGP